MIVDLMHFLMHAMVGSTPTGRHTFNMFPKAIDPETVFNKCRLRQRIGEKSYMPWLMISDHFVMSVRSSVSVPSFVSTSYL